MQVGEEDDFSLIHYGVNFVHKNRAIENVS